MSKFEIYPLGEMDADATFFCGQAFRWEKHDGFYEGVAANSYARVEALSDRLVVESGKDDEEFWQNYFAAKTDYAAIRELFLKDEALAECVRYAPGIRVLCQPFFETLCTFIISQNNNVPRITGIVKRFCSELGQNLGEGRFAFPTPDAVASLTPDDLAPLRAGFRARYLIDAAQKVASGLVCENQLREMSSDDARKSLCTIVGVGPKVADCVLLFSLSKNEIIPMDVHMKRAMQNRFPNGLSNELKPYGGIAQQYIFHHERTAGGAQKPNLD